MGSTGMPMKYRSPGVYPGAVVVMTLNEHHLCHVLIPKLKLDFLPDFERTELNSLQNLEIELSSPTSVESSVAVVCAELDVLKKRTHQF